jgi:adenosylcobinamide amidohydrolase
MLTLERPWLTLELGAPHCVLSWAINRPGAVTAKRILWREVRNADLPQDFDVHAWLDSELAGRGDREAVCFLTSRDVSAHHDTTITVDGETVRAIATVGLSNAERVGSRVDRHGKDWGTINIAVITPAALTEAARIEAACIAAQARTVAVMEAGLNLPTGLATGTGTDCIAVASPAGPGVYAGLHTALGEAIGQAVLGVMRAGVTEWMATQYREEAS